MKTITITLLLAAAASIAGCSSQSAHTDTVHIAWDNSLTLPSTDGNTPNIGMAGAFAGIVNNKLIVAGGANFPDGYPWTGATKVWHDMIYCLDLATGQWSTIPGLMEHPLAYGVSVQLPQGVLMIGGGNSSEITSNVSLLTESNGQLTIDRTAFPPLPFPLANMTGTMTDGKIFVAGGVTDIAEEQSSHTFLMLDLDSIDRGWNQLEPWPGAPLGYSVSVGIDGLFYLFSGREFGPDRDLTMHDEGYCYNPATGSWTRLDNRFPMMAGTAISRDGDVWFIGGVEQVLPTTPDHPGFSRVVRRYHIGSNTIDTVSVSPFPLAVTTTTVVTGDTIYVASGEEKPGIRTPHILKGIITAQ